ncbi:hypothetical protein D3C81_2040600 [compost metagenome]
MMSRIFNTNERVHFLIEHADLLIRYQGVGQKVANELNVTIKKLHAILMEHPDIQYLKMYNVLLIKAMSEGFKFNEEANEAVQRLHAILMDDENFIGK